MSIGLRSARGVGTLVMSTVLLAGCGGGGVEYQAAWPMNWSISPPPSTEVRADLLANSS